MIEYNFDNILHLQSKFWHLIFFSIKEEIRTEILGQVLHIKRIRREGILFIWFFFFFFFFFGHGYELKATIQASCWLEHIKIYITFKIRIFLPGLCRTEA